MQMFVSETVYKTVGNWPTLTDRCAVDVLQHDPNLGGVELRGRVRYLAKSRHIKHMLAAEIDMLSLSSFTSQSPYAFCGGTVPYLGEGLN